MDEQAPLVIDVERMRKLGRTLRARFQTYVKARQTTELQWLKNIRQFIGEYDPQILQSLSPEQSRAYPRLTRVKVLSLVARLHAMMFPAGEKNWAIEASPVPVLPPDVLSKVLVDWMQANPQAVATQDELDRVVKVAAEDIAKRMSIVVDDQLGDTGVYGATDYQALVRDVMFSATLYNCGVLKGPMTIAEKGAQLMVDDNGVPQVVEADLYRPFFETVSLWDYYPDFSAKTFAQMDGQFQRHIYSRHTFALLADREDFMGDAIRDILREKPEGNYVKMNYELLLWAMSDDKRTTQPGEYNKFELIEYWGTVSGHDLRSAGVDIPDSDLAKDTIACVWMVDDTVIKVAASPFPPGVQMYHQFVFERDEVNLMGSSLAQIMRDSQLGVSTFTRMLVDNAATVCGPNVEVDAEQLSASTNPNSIRPFKAWIKDNPSANGARAVQNLSFDSHIGELMEGIRLMRDFADTETFVNPMTGGDFENTGGEALRTTGNMSMALATAALPFKDIVRNFDTFTKSVVHALIHWNLIYNPRRDELRGDLRPVPRGASSLMAKEVRAVALDQLAASLTDGERVYINEEELLKERLQVRDLPLDRLLASPEDVQQRQQSAAEQAQKAQQQQDQLFAADLRTKQTEALKDITQAQKNADAGDALVLKTLVDAIERGANIEELSRIAQRGDRQMSGTAEAGAAAQGGAAGTAGRPLAASTGAA